MILPIIDSFIKEVNNLAGDPNSPSFDEELTSCLFVMANEDHPVKAGCKIFMLNISTEVLRKILTYLTILKLRSDSLRSPDGKPINQDVLTLALRGIVYALAREEEPLKFKSIPVQSEAANLSTNSPREEKSNPVLSNPVPSTSYAPPSTQTSARSPRQSISNRPRKHSADSLKSSIGPLPGTSKQSILCKQSAHRPASDVGESSPSKQVARGLHTPTKVPAQRGRRGRTSSISSTSSASPLSVMTPPPSNESHQLPIHVTASVVKPRLPPFTSVIVSPGPSSNPRPPFTVSYTPISSSSSSTETIKSSHDEPTFGLNVTFDCTVSLPMQQGLIRVLEPYRHKIETTPICANHLFIKLKDKKDIYFIKRQIEIITCLNPKIVVTKFARYQLNVPKQLAPTIREFVNLNASLLRGDYYVYSRASTSNENITKFEILASPECQQILESCSCLLKIGQELRSAIPVKSYVECPRCFFCYDDAHTECSEMTLMETGNST